MKFPFVKQEGYFLLGVPHEKRFFRCLRWWISRRNKHCKSCCLTCKWWFRCQEDVAFEDSMRYKGGKKDVRY